MDRTPLTACDSVSDCGATEVCRAEGYCGCSHVYGFEHRPECHTLSAGSSWAVVITPLLLLIVVVCIIYAAYVLAEVAISKRQTYMYSTVMFSLLWGILLAATLSHELAHVISAGTYPDNTITFETLYFLGLSLSCAAMNASGMNISLMWIEFILATERCDSVKSNLHNTAAFLKWYIAVFLVLLTTLLFLGSLVNSKVQYAWLAINLFSALVLVVLFIMGSRRMSAVFFRAADNVEIYRPRSRASSIARAVLQHNGHHASANNILLTARFITAAAILYSCGSVVALVAADRGAARGIYWFSVLITFVGTACFNVAIARCVHVSLNLTSKREAAPRTGEHGEQQSCASVSMQSCSLQRGSHFSGSVSTQLSSMQSCSIQPKSHASGSVSTQKHVALAATPEIKLSRSEGNV